MNVVVTGSLGYDYIMDFPGRFADRIMPEKIHQISLSFHVNKLTKNFGGTAGNIAYTLNLLGIKPQILSCAGNDFGAYKHHLDKHRLATTHIKAIKNVTTGAYFVVTDMDDNQIGSFYLGGSIYNHQLTLTEAKPKIDFVVIAPNSPPALNKFVRECRKLKLPYLYDPAFQIGSLSASDLHRGIEGAQILIGNDYEMALIEKKLQVSHQELRQLVPTLITTLGHKGSIIETKNEKIVIPVAKPKNTSDPTGAGDAYRAGFLAGYLRGFDLPTCGKMGSVAAVYTVEKYGTQTHWFTKKDFGARFRNNFKEKVNLD